MLLWEKRYPVALHAFIIICYTWSFSIQHVVTRHTVPFNTVSNTLLSMTASTSTNWEHNSRIIQSLSKAKSAKDVDDTLCAVFCLSPQCNNASRNDINNINDVEFIHLNDATIENTLNKFPQFSMDVLAAAIRRLALISARDIRQNNCDSQIPFLNSLLETIARQMVIAQKDHGLLSVYALSDILQALTILVYVDADTDSANRDWTGLFDQIMDSTVEMLTRHDISELKKLGPIRLLQCLQAMARLGMVETLLHYRIYEQLLKPNASSRLPAKYLAHGLDALSIVVINRVDSAEDMETHLTTATKATTTTSEKKISETTLLARSFMRRLRKKQVQETASMDDLCRALLAADDLWHAGGLKDLEDEAAIFGFTILRAILQKKHATNVRINPSQMSTMISAWATLTSNQKEDMVIDDLLNICEADQILERCSLVELQRIIVSIQQLQITNHASIMRSGGERLVNLTLNGKISPKIFNSILRCPVLLHRKNDFVMEPYVRACESVFVDPAFLDQCDVAEIANFLWFASIARWRHEGVLQALAKRIMDPEICDRSSPKLACRILATYTSIVSLPDNEPHSSEQQLHEITAQLFHSYGGHLLTTKLTPAEVSAALYAYAKSSYFHDMGIFDHLLSLMAQMTYSADIPTVRQMTQSLWSCGKMSVFDSNENTQDTVEEPESHYFQSASTIAEALSRRTDELSQVDVTQCIWALGRLGTTNEQVISPFAKRASALVHCMNAVEISNVLWGFAKLDYSDNILVYRMALRLTDGDLLLSPKEAAMALYALGRLGIRDERIYATLSEVMIDKIEETSAQAVANTLWAYRNVNLRPPQDLLNFWAIQKLGWVNAFPSSH